MDSLALLILIGACAGGALGALAAKAHPLQGVLIAAAFTITAGIVSLYHELLGWVAGVGAAAVVAMVVQMRSRQAVMVVIGTMMGAFAGVALGGLLFPRG